MSMFERLLVPGSTERPTCRCGEVMEVASIEQLSEGSDAIALSIAASRRNQVASSSI